MRERSRVGRNAADGAAAMLEEDGRWRVPGRRENRDMILSTARPEIVDETGLHIAAFVARVSWSWLRCIAS